MTIAARARKMTRPGFALRRHAIIGAAMAIALPSIATAQNAPAKSEEKFETLQQRDKELDSLRGEQRKAAETQSALTRDIESIGAERRRLNQDLLATADKVRTLESQIAAAEQRLKPLDEQERTFRQSLEGRRAVIGEVLAALQRIGRRPPPALMTAPEDALQAVRTAIMLGAVLPEMRQEAEVLAQDLASLGRVRKEIAQQREMLSIDVAAIPKERERLEQLIQQRQQKQAESEKALDAERERAAGLARQAGDLKDLIAKLEQSLDGPARAAREAARNDQRPELSAFRDPGRLVPAALFTAMRGKLPVPVNGVKIRDYGSADSSGGVEKGVSVATRAAAQVVSPADGWVVYAGPFRTYGQLLILNAGGGYHILLAGMERISVDLGQFVLTGEPVAVMGNGSRVAAVLATGSGQPVLYVEFRKDGVPVDPGPWWAINDGEKVRG
jgi:septal ring factor EnvC (AmiA/AmiB activator)